MPDPGSTKTATITTIAGTAAGRPHSNRPVYLAGFVFIAITIAAAWIAIWELRRDRIADEMHDTTNLAVVLAAQTARTFQAIDLVLREAQGFVQAAGVTDPDQFRQR